VFSGKKYHELSPTQQIKLFDELNRSSNSFMSHKQATIVENDKKALLTRKKVGAYDMHEPS
jgi:hypothetical protein